MKGTCCVISYALAFPQSLTNIVELLCIVTKGRILCVVINEECNVTGRYKRGVYVMVNCEEVIATTE